VRHARGVAGLAFERSTEGEVAIEPPLGAGGAFAGEEAAQQVGEAATKGLGEAVKGIGDGLGGLLGGEKKK